LLFKLSDPLFKKDSLSSETSHFDICKLSVLYGEHTLCITSCLKLHDPRHELLVLDPRLIDGLVSDTNALNEIVTFPEKGLELELHLHGLLIWLASHVTRGL